MLLLCLQVYGIFYVHSCRCYVVFHIHSIWLLVKKATVDQHSVCKSSMDTHSIIQFSLTLLNSLRQSLYAVWPWLTLNGSVCCMCRLLFFTWISYKSVHLVYSHVFIEMWRSSHSHSMAFKLQTFSAYSKFFECFKHLFYWMQVHGKVLLWVILYVWSK